jgi:hypothetical protein
MVALVPARTNSCQLAIVKVGRQLDCFTHPDMVYCSGHGKNIFRTYFLQCTADPIPMQCYVHVMMYMAHQMM